MMLVWQRDITRKEARKGSANQHPFWISKQREIN
jgi:hypothetical protein